MFPGAESLHIRCVTLGINLRGAALPGPSIADAVRDRIVNCCRGFGRAVAEVSDEGKLPVLSTRVATSPAAWLVGPSGCPDPVQFALGMEAAVPELNAEPGGCPIDFIGGYTALAQAGFGSAARAVVESLPDALAATKHVCASVNVAATRSGINLAAVRAAAGAVKATAVATPQAHGCARLVVTANAPDGGPYMPATFHGDGLPDRVVHVGVGGLGVLREIVEAGRSSRLETLAADLQATVAAMARRAEQFGRAVADRIGAALGVVDLSLAPTIAPEQNSVAGLLEALGLDLCGGHGTIAALAFILDAVKKGGTAGSPLAGGLSGAFLPVSEDAGMIRAVLKGGVSLAKLHALTCVCCVGLDMIGLPGWTTVDVLAGLIADQAALGVMNQKATAVRALPVPGAEPGDVIDLTGHNPLFGKIIIMPTDSPAAPGLFDRGDDSRVPPPYRSLTN